MMKQPNYEPEGEVSAVLKAADIEPAIRQWAASVLHVDLSDTDELRLGLRRVADSERPARREAARRRLLALLATIDERMRDVPDEAMEKAIEEGMQFVRSSRDT